MKRDSWDRAFKSLSSARYQSRPDAVFVHSIPGRPALRDPTNIPPPDRSIHFVEFKSCPDTIPYPTLDAAAAQHASTLTRLKTRCLRTPNTSWHIILIGVVGTTYLGIHNDYTIKPLINLGLARQKAILGLLERGLAGCVAVESGRGESGRPGAWPTKLQTLITSISGFL
eukprot:1153092-Pelagomonas_calceolata.AAC.1